MSLSGFYTAVAVDQDQAVVTQINGTSGSYDIFLHELVDGAEADGADFEEEVRKWVLPGESRVSGTWCCTHAHYQVRESPIESPLRAH